MSRAQRRRAGVLLCAASILAVFLNGCGTAPSASDRSVKPVPAARKGEAADAAVPVARAEEVLPPEAVQRFDAAVVHMNAGDHAAAEQAFRALASEYPAYSGPLVNLGILAAKAGRFEEAEKTLKGALERNPRNATALNQLGIVYRKLGRFAEADEAYQKAVQADPNYANAYLNLGVLCDLYLQQPKRALEAYERYLELTPSPDSRVNGWVTELRKRVGAAEPAAAGG